MSLAVKELLEKISSIRNNSWNALFIISQMWARKYVGKVSGSLLIQHSKWERILYHPRMHKVMPARRKKKDTSPSHLRWQVSSPNLHQYPLLRKKIIPLSHPLCQQQLSCSSHPFQPAFSCPKRLSKHSFAPTPPKRFPTKCLSSTSPHYFHPPFFIFLSWRATLASKGRTW